MRLCVLGRGRVDGSRSLSRGHPGWTAIRAPIPHAICIRQPDTPTRYAHPIRQPEPHVPNILHIVCSPREASQSRLVADALVGTYIETHAGARVDELNLWDLALPEMREDVLNAKYAILGRREHTPAQAAAWATVQAEVARLLAYDVFLISTPMWNWSLPYRLKHYIDVVTQPGLTFKWTPERGYEGLVLGRRAVVVYASSFDYGHGSPLARLDHQKSYLEDWLRIIGVDDIRTIAFGPTHPDAPAMPAMRDQALRRAVEIARQL